MGLCLYMSLDSHMKVCFIAYYRFLKLQVRFYLFLSLDFHRDLQPDGPGHTGLVRSLLQVVPHVHLARQGPDLDDGLAEEVVGFSSEFLSKFRLQVVVLVPYSDLDPVR